MNCFSLMSQATLGSSPSIPPHSHLVGVTLGVWRGLPSTSSQSQRLTEPALGVAFLGSGLDLWGCGQCPGLGVRRPGVWNWVFL